MASEFEGTDIETLNAFGSELLKGVERIVKENIPETVPETAPESTLGTDPGALSKVCGACGYRAEVPVGVLPLYCPSCGSPYRSGLPNDPVEVAPLDEAPEGEVSLSEVESRQSALAGLNEEGDSIRGELAALRSCLPPRGSVPWCDQDKLRDVGDLIGIRERRLQEVATARSELTEKKGGG